MGPLPPQWPTTRRQCRRAVGRSAAESRLRGGLRMLGAGPKSRGHPGRKLNPSRLPPGTTAGVLLVHGHGPHLGGSCLQGGCG